MPTITDLQAKLAEYTARYDMQTELMERLKEELVDMGVDVDNPEEEIERLENEIETNQAKRAQYIKKARVIIERYESGSRSTQ
jgi:chromosome segregation ATPase